MSHIEKIDNTYVISCELFLSENEFEKFNKAKKIERLIVNENVSNNVMANILFTCGMRKFLKDFDDYDGILLDEGDLFDE